jgi:excisionase family DNA binding protein
MKDRYLSTVEAAKVMGISRVAVLKQIKTGRLRAERVGRNYIIDRNDLAGIFRHITPGEKKRVTVAMKKVMKQYGPALKKLGKE